MRLPELANADYIEWDRDTDTIRPGPRFDEVASLVDVLVRNEDEIPAEWP